MSSTADWGVSDEIAIAKSGVRNIFTPHTPVSAREQLFGRQDEISQLLRQIGTPGQHSLLFGERGVGKSSLAKVAKELLSVFSIVDGPIFDVRCDPTTTFSQIVESPLLEAGVPLEMLERTEATSIGGKAGLRFPIGEAGMDTRTETAERNTPLVRPESPAWVADKVASVGGLLIVDELDVISEQEVRARVAQFVKFLSDLNSGLKVIMVGIAETGMDLMGGHPSVQRCIRETRVKRMSDASLREIITSGAERLDIDFTDDVIEKIVSLSAGYPHFTHLLGLKCAEQAIVRPSQNPIDIDDLRSAMGAAIADTEGTLRSQYEVATRSHQTDAYERIVISAAQLNSETFTAAQLREAIKVFTGKTITQASLNNYFKRLIASDQSCILRRVAKGVYRFTDPRMPSFVRIKHQLV